MRATRVSPVARKRATTAVMTADTPFSDPLAWRPVKAPSLGELEALAETAFARLPQKFRALCEGLVIRVEDFPTDEVLDELGAQTEFDLLGLFQGVGRRRIVHRRTLPAALWPAPAAGVERADGSCAP